MHVFLEIYIYTVLFLKNECFDVAVYCSEAWHASLSIICFDLIFTRLPALLFQFTTGSWLVCFTSHQMFWRPGFKSPTAYGYGWEATFVLPEYKESNAFRNIPARTSAIVVPESASGTLRSGCFSCIHSRHDGDVCTLRCFVTWLKNRKFIWQRTFS